MQYLVLKSNKVNSINEFIGEWSKFYTFTNEILYQNSISKLEFTIRDIQNLFVWKNGMKLSKLKQKSVNEKIKYKIEIINDFKTSNNFDLSAFKKEFRNLTAVWKIFLLHIIKPNKYPIYDQHIHRAYLFIANQNWKNLSNDTISNKTKEKFYFEIYLPFLESNEIQNLKQLDEAFFAFGQFLKTRNNALLLT